MVVSVQYVRRLISYHYGILLKCLYAHSTKPFTTTSVLANPSNFENCAFSYFRKSSLRVPSEMLIFLSVSTSQNLSSICMNPTVLWNMIWQSSRHMQIRRKILSGVVIAFYNLKVYYLRFVNHMKPHSDRSLLCTQLLTHKTGHKDTSNIS
jgi:hypothetical protein